MTAGNRLRGAPRQVRIIGGQWKRTPLPVPDVVGLRPTPDRVRETLFNWLQHLLPDSSSLRGLDLFAGTGALGFELASRGARYVLLVESNPRRARIAAGHARPTVGQRRRSAGRRRTVGGGGTCAGDLRCGLSRSSL